MSSTTFMHIGYTGTCICIDPLNKLFSAVLTTRLVILIFLVMCFQQKAVVVCKHFYNVFFVIIHQVCS